MIGERFRLVRCDPSGQPVEATLRLSSELAENCRQTANLYAQIGYVSPWVGYLSVSGDVPVGGGAFVGAPQKGRAEIAYYTLAEFEGRGFATGTAQGLVALARAADPSVTLFAKTLPEHNASTRILSKIGFSFAGETHDDDVGVAWLWELAPAPN